MIFTYNKEQVGDILMIIVQDDKGAKISFERRGRLARVFLEETGETTAWNIFDVSSLISLEGKGQVWLSAADIEVLNRELSKEGFDQRLEHDTSPKFVVGEIVGLTPHPDSDHLHICQVQVTSDKVIQIVAGAPNAREGIKTIVALPGAMMPDGSLIFPGKLRGETSNGMMCAPRELQLTNAPQEKGIIELPASTPIGEAFSPGKHWQS